MDIKQIKYIVKNITFAPSNLDMGWKWQAKESYDKDSVLNGFFIRTSFKRPDTNDGKIGIGFGRWMFVDKNTDERGVVMTAWVCAKLIVEHELMEAFLYKNTRILDPHKSLSELAYPKILNKIKIGHKNDLFKLVKKTDNFKRGKQFESFGGLVDGVVTQINGEEKTIKFFDKNWFALCQ